MQNSKEDFEDSPRGSSDASVQELLAETVASLEITKPTLAKNVYQRLANVWCDTSKLMPLRQSMWVAIESCPEMRFHGVPCRFGASISDLQALSTELAWDYPKGIAAIHLDRCKTLVFSPDYGPNVARVDSALAWLRQFDGLGLALRKRGDDIELGFVDVLWFPGQNTSGARRRDLFVAAVAAVVGSTRAW